MGHSTSPAEPAADGGIQVIDRATTLMRTIARSPRALTAQQLAAACQLNRTTAWRILSSLEHNGLVYRDPSTQQYSIGVDLARLGESVEIAPLIRVARPHLQGLADAVGEQVSLGVARQLGFLYVDHVKPADGISVPRWLGESGPLHASASGKVFLSRLTPTEREAALQQGLPRFTSTTITELAALNEELAAVGTDGVSFAVGEYDELTNAICAPAVDPRDDRLVAVIDVWGPGSRLPPSRLRDIAPLVRRTAGEIGSLMSQHGAEVRRT